MRFESFDVPKELIERLRQQGLTTPTPVQEKAIPPLLQGEDVIVQAQTGTGKTLAFVLPILKKVDPSEPRLQALIITPTRELALQITTELQKLAPATGASVLAVYGGQDVESQIRRLKGAAQIVIGTPGRLLDHVRRQTIDLSGVSQLVLDEADQMLAMGFQQEVEDVIRRTPNGRQTMLFSATMSNAVRKLASAFMRSPLDIRVLGEQVSLETIEQIVVDTSDRNKQRALIRTMEWYKPFLGVIFCRTKVRAKKLTEELVHAGYNVDEIHGDLTQAKREQVMEKFREAKLQYLVATDVAARGLDVEGVTHVFNYDIPHDPESYIHRIGRTGRAGKTGTALTFISPRDRFYLQQIERAIGMRLEHRGDSEFVGERIDTPKAAVREPRGSKPQARGGKGRQGAGASRFGKTDRYAKGRGERTETGRFTKERGGERAETGRFTKERGGERAETGRFAKDRGERAETGRFAKEHGERAETGRSERERTGRFDRSAKPRTEGRGSGRGFEGRKDFAGGTAGSKDGARKRGPAGESAGRGGHGERGGQARTQARTGGTGSFSRRDGGGSKGGPGGRRGRTAPKR